MLGNAAKVIAHQWSRLQTVRRALFEGSLEHRCRAFHFLVVHLPLSAATKEEVLRRGFARILGQDRRPKRARIKRAQEIWNSRGEGRLAQLLAGDERIRIQQADKPELSIILILRNKSHLSLLSIESIVRFTTVPYELLIVDNGSTDATDAMLARIDGAKIIRNSDNAGFGPACMQAVAQAAGEYLCFFNNDALLTDGAIEAAMRDFESPDVGAVGGKILLSNGALQEAGSLIWSDGSALGYGRGDEPNSPKYNFRRPVDYCSAVFLITPAEIFRECGGFSNEFAPAYYEDTDYCMTLWSKGKSVIYEPTAVIEHFESASSGGNQHATAQMAAHQVKFRNKWHKELQRHREPHRNNVCAARIAVNSGGLRIVYIDDRIPRRYLGAGFPRSNDVVTALASLGHHVTCCTSTFPLIADEPSELPPTVELFDGFRFGNELVEEYMACADVVWVSRPHNMKRLRRDFPEALKHRKFALVYDAEAVFADRTTTHAALKDAAALPTGELDPASREEEIALAKLADLVTVVSEADQRTLADGGVKLARVVGHSLSIEPTASSYDRRDAFLFIGSVHGISNPNADSIRHFCLNEWPKVRERTGARLLVAGYGTEALRVEITDPSVEFLGKQADLRPLYERARVFVVPTRFAAGLPFKAHEAAGYGIPMVVSSLIHSQMSWTNGEDYLAASKDIRMSELCVRLYDDQLLWERLRTNSLYRVRDELSPAAFLEAIRSALASIER